MSATGLECGTGLVVPWVWAVAERKSPALRSSGLSAPRGEEQIPVRLPLVGTRSSLRAGSPRRAAPRRNDKEGGAAEAAATAWASGARQLITFKKLGEISEAAFLAKAERLGYGVAKPWGDSDRYDFIVDVAGRLWKVQVKSAYRAGQDGGYSFRLYGHSVGAYREDEIDVLVAYIVPEDAWYVFPACVFRGRRSVKLFGGSRRRRSKFEKYREGWWVMEQTF